MCQLLKLICCCSIFFAFISCTPLVVVIAKLAVPLNFHISLWFLEQFLLAFYAPIHIHIQTSMYILICECYCFASWSNFTRSPALLGTELQLLPQAPAVLLKSDHSKWFLWLSANWWQVVAKVVHFYASTYIYMCIHTSVWSCANLHALHVCICGKCRCCHATTSIKQLHCGYKWNCNVVHMKKGLFTLVEWQRSWKNRELVQTYVYL